MNAVTPPHRPLVNDTMSKEQALCSSLINDKRFANQLMSEDQHAKPEGEDSGWMDRFMASVFEKDYTAAGETLRVAICKGTNQNLAMQYAKVLEEFLRGRDTVENPVVLAHFGPIVVKQLENGTGRGIVTNRYYTTNEELWHERPLIKIQSPASRKCVQVCFACLKPLGTLKSQLAYLGYSTPHSDDDIVVGGSYSGDPLYTGQVIPCSGAGCCEVFCSTDCRDWELANSSHNLLCAAKLRPSQFEALCSIAKLAEDAGHENLLMLAHGVAQMTLCREHGESLEEIQHRFVRQFVSQSWESLASDIDDKDGDDTPAKRRELLTKEVELLHVLFEGNDLAEPFLEVELLDSLLSTFELTSMSISIAHPLNSFGPQLCTLLGGETLAKILKTQRMVDEDSESEGSTDDGASQNEVSGRGSTENEEQSAQSNSPAEEALECARKGKLFAHVTGAGLFERVAFTNHCCLPNCSIEFATAGQEKAHGPGLCLYTLANRPLIPGDELLMTYVPTVVAQPYRVRQRRMKRFGFTCRCRTCVTDEILIADGDLV